MRRLIKTQYRKKMAHILLAGFCMFGILMTASDGFAISSVASGGCWQDKNTWGGVRIPVNGDFIEINGTVTVDGSPGVALSGLTVNVGATLTNFYKCYSDGCGGGATVYVTGDVTNNGTISNNATATGPYVSFLDLSISGNISNNGTWNNRNTWLTGTQSRSITGNPIHSRIGLAGFEITNSPVFQGDVYFDGTKLTAGQSVTCSKNVSGGVNIPGATLILNGADQKLAASVNAKEVFFGGTGTKTMTSGSDMSITGKVTVQEGVTLTESARYITFDGDVINNGTITDMDLSVTGNIANNGTWKNGTRLVLTGTQSRSITGNPIQSNVGLDGSFEIINSPVFAGNVYFFSSIKLSSGQSFTFFKDVTGSISYVNIPEGNVILSGGDQKIGIGFTAKEISFGGTGTKTVSSMTIGKLAVPKDVTLTGSGTLTVNGDASNSGTITGSLSLKISGNITNSGTWNNSSTYVFWTPVSGASFYDFNITDNLSTWPAPTKPSGTSYNVGSLLTSENYWRVRASISGTLTAWSDVKSINSSGSVPTVKKGDVNGSGGDPDLADAIPVLRILAGISVTETINLNADVNGDGKIGIEEVIYILQIVAGLRTP